MRSQDIPFWPFLWLCSIRSSVSHSSSCLLQCLPSSISFAHPFYWSFPVKYNGIKICSWHWPSYTTLLIYWTAVLILHTFFFKLGSTFMWIIYKHVRIIYNWSYVLHKIKDWRNETIWRNPWPLYEAIYQIFKSYSAKLIFVETELQMWVYNYTVNCQIN